MDEITVEHLCFQYPDTGESVLDDVFLRVSSGEFLTLCGPSGCGKTTLLRLLKKDIAPAGEQKGMIRLQGEDITTLSHGVLARAIGMVFQDPDNQIVMDHVMQELVFGMENLGFSTTDMHKKVAEMVHFFGLGSLLERQTYELSGGQKQLVNLAAVILLDPDVLLLDEPTAQLDPVAAKDFVYMIHRLNQEFGLTVIIVEHRLEELFPLSDRVVFMKQGRIAYEGGPRQVSSQLWQQDDCHLQPYLPDIAQLYFTYESEEHYDRVPLTVREGRGWLENVSGHAEYEPTIASVMDKEAIMEVKGIHFQYDKHKDKVLRHLFLKLYRGEKLAVVGGNGSGKSTLLKVFAGLLQPQQGHVFYEGKKVKKQQPQHLGYLPQNPKQYFLHDTVRKEIDDVAAQFNTETDVDRLVSYFGLSAVLDRHPYDLSGGEMQKAALLCVLLQQPAVLFIDEPTKGLDPVMKKQFGYLLNSLHEESVTIVMVTHDIEFAAQYADRCAMMFRGQVTATDAARVFFTGNRFYTTMMNRMTRRTAASTLLTLEEAKTVWSAPD